MIEAMRRAPRRRLSEDEKRARRARIFERLREGYEVAEIAKRERLTPQRIRQTRQRGPAGAASRRAGGARGDRGRGAEAAPQARGAHGRRGRPRNDPGAGQDCRSARSPRAGRRCARGLMARSPVSVMAVPGSGPGTAMTSFRLKKAAVAGASNGAGTATLYFESLKPRKSLKSLVSYEKIQENPSRLKSNIATKTVAI